MKERKGARYIGKGPCREVIVNDEPIPEGWVCWSPQSLVRSLLQRDDFEAEGNGPPPDKPRKKVSKASPAEAEE